jgi:hypothetical protein
LVIEEAAMTYRTLRGVVCATVILGAQTAAAAGVTLRHDPEQQPSSSIVLAADVEGRFIVRNAAKELVAEVYKPPGRTLSVTVDPGAYEVRVERDRSALIARVNVAEGADVVLDRQQLAPLPVDVVPAPVQGEVMPYAVTSRNRFDVRFGAWSHGPDYEVIDGVDTSNVLGGIRYTRYFRESLAATFSIEGGGSQVGTFATRNGVYDGVSGIVAVPVGIRWNPLKYGRQADGIKPYLAFSAGPVFGNTVADGHRRDGWGNVQSTATIGGFAGGGVDFHAGRTFVIGVDAGYNWMGDFAMAIGGHDNYSGPSVSISLGCMWGRGSTPRP